MTTSRTTKIDTERAEKLYDTISLSPSEANKVMPKLLKLEIDYSLSLIPPKAKINYTAKKCKVSSLDIQLIFS